LENAKKLNVIPLIGAEILFVFFSKTKRLERKAGKWLGKCPSVLVQNFINGCW
jgi:hypothetical protein